MRSRIAVPLLVGLLGLVLAACNSGPPPADAYGNFEATEVVVSAEANGQLLQFPVDEGQRLAAQQQVGQVDDAQLKLRRKQLVATRAATAAKRDAIAAQVSVLQTQRANAQRDLKRVEQLVLAKAATAKQRDDLAGNIDVINRQIASVRTGLQPLQASLDALDAQIGQLDDQIANSKVVNPIAGTVLATYAEPGEVTAFGKPLYKIADLTHMKLKAYISGEQLGALKIGQTVTARFDNGKGGMSTRPGKVAWIASNAEFTPKVIQTRQERVGLVYAVKIDVLNPDGAIKIGMPGEVDFHPPRS